jgi:pantetheine-phosphate adenylyltransferase
MAGRKKGTPMSDRGMRVALYPGTFDPIHNGHVDIIGRAARLVDRLVIGVAINTGKGPLFSLPDRVAIVQAECHEIARRTGTIIEVMPFQGLLVAFAQQIGATMIVRGLRAVTDFDYEFQMAGMNYRLSSDVETVFLMASEHHQFIASRFVKEIALMGGDISSFVSPYTLERTMKQVNAAKSVPETSGT